MKALGSRLRGARERAGLSQGDAARRAGLGDSSLSEFENDRRTPSLAQLAELARVYAVSMGALLSEKEESAAATVLWRKKPAQKAGELEAQFLRLADQYANLERWSGNVVASRLPKTTKSAETFGEADAEELAREVRQALGLGDRPALVLLRALEEDCGVKVFHLAFEPTGTAASAHDEKFGDAVLLNAGNAPWRRNYDLAHELFHLLTWNVFRSGDGAVVSGAREERLAEHFAAALLMPEEALRSAVTRRRRDNKLTTAALFEIARDFGVSTEALLWRLHEIYGGKDRKYTKARIAALREVAPLYDDRSQDTPPARPERFRALAVTALREGEMSIGRFAEYMGVSRGEAMKYAEQEAAPDEALELPSP